MSKNKNKSLGKLIRKKKEYIYNIYCLLHIMNFYICKFIFI